MTDNIQGSLAKTFDPAAIEAKWYAHWESSGAFRPSRPGAESYTIVMPPPNVTGSLHIGHALDNTLQDILIRHARLQGKDALWVVGTDHAGIATQMVVERQMALHQQKRTDFTRDEFIAKVWEWKAESGGTITSQLRRLGASCDWANERFTMDEGFSKAVIKVFVDLYNQGLLYRDKRLVNWDPGLKTAISDLEVETREVNGKFWHFKYPLEDGSGFISVATTRPETMLADMAVAVNPDDDRYKALVGKNVRLPITGRLIPIVADEHADPELGSGAVKITPGHDFNDFEVGKRAGFKAGEMLNMLDAEAKVVQIYEESCEVFDAGDGEETPNQVFTPTIPTEWVGLDRFDVRKLVVERMKETGFLVPHVDNDGNTHDAEPRTIQTPFGDRSSVVIEPWLTDQWYVDAATLAKPAIEAVRSGAIKVVPQTWEKTYFNWMENIQPWCVSRQLWWGHRIPVWYGPYKDGDSDDPGSHSVGGPRPKKSFVGYSFEEISILARDYYGYGSIIEEAADDEDIDLFHALRRQVENIGNQNAPIFIAGDEPNLYRLKLDSDVLDTWFSSALWPFGTLGWPDAENPPRNGEVARSDGGGPSSGQSGAGGNLGPLRPVGAPPRFGEDLLSRHYPNDILISGFDILFFWDARMIMQGLHFMKEVPWKTLYLHGLVRAADGSKMSKSKGNTVDPLGLIDQYGADALRFTLTAMESQGRDIKLDEKRVEGYRNFATKLWNAARFCQANGIGASTSVAAPNAELAVNRWIIGEAVETLAKLNQAITDLRFDAMADSIYHFAWGTFCDWYLELIKPILSPLPFRGGAGGGDCPPTSTPESVDSPHPNPSPEGEGLEAKETRAVAAWVFDQILVMLHPFMPFITEELWGAAGTRDYELIHAKWPEPEARVDDEAKAEIEWLIRLISDIRSARTEANVPPSEKLLLGVREAPSQIHIWMKNNCEALKKMARLLMVTPDPVPTEGSLIISHSEATYLLPFADFIDAPAERARITNAITAITKERDALTARLNNPAFVEKAKPEAVEKARADHAEKSAEVNRLQAALARLG
jgi:valyl-tRNA synthetase